MKKRAAMELSVSTIVVIVLAMSMLIFGLILVKNIFAGGTRAVDSINDQVADNINKMFGEDKKVVIYPAVNPIEVRQGKEGGFAIGIKNKLTGSQSQNAKFSYEVTPVSDTMKNCGVSNEEIKNLFVAGSEKDSDIPIATNSDSYKIAILFNTGEGDPLCTVRFRVDVRANGNNYDTSYVFVKFRD